MIEGEQLKALQKFVLDNADLEQLEDLLSSFNLLETLKIVDAEIRHSNVLAWLLQPDSTHGLGDYFLRKILKVIAADAVGSTSDPKALFQFESMDLFGAEIRREWEHTDITIIIPASNGGVVIAIENKVKSEEHSNQLVRYRKSVEEHFGGYTSYLVYLTPSGTTPGDDNWQIMEYKTIADLLERTLNAKRGSLGQDIRIFLEHYLVALRRYIVGNSEMEVICRKIYEKHKEALDLIYQFRPDVVMELSNYLQKKIDNIPGLILDTSSKASVRFTTTKLDQILPSVGHGWTKSKRILLFEFVNSKGLLTLRLYVGPGDQNERAKLLKMFEQDKKIFKLMDRKRGTKWHAVWQKKILTKEEYEGSEFEDFTQKIDKKITTFLEKELPLIESFIVNNYKP